MIIYVTDYVDVSNVCFQSTYNLYILPMNHMIWPYVSNLKRLFPMSFFVSNIFLCFQSNLFPIYVSNLHITVLVVHGDLRSLIIEPNDQFRYFIYYKTEIQSIQTRKTKLRSTKLPTLPWQIKFKYWFKLGNSSLDKFNFRWLKNSAIEIGKAASIALISSHLNGKPS